MSRGRFAGPSMPSQTLASKAGRPASVTVGTSGSSETRWPEVTARPRSLPERTWGAPVSARSNITGTLPEITSITAIGLALYGTWTIFVPVIARNSSVARCPVLPMPAVA